MADEADTTEELDKKIATDPFEDQNAATMAEIVSDPTTSEFVKLQILNTLLAVESNATFHETMFKEGMTYCRCPECGHQNHWLIPEDNLNEMGYVTADEDERVKHHTTKEDCPRYAEACAKKCVSA